MITLQRADATRVLSELLSQQHSGVIVIDGYSGAGKTSLAEELIHELGEQAVVLSLEDLYQGWEGLAEGSRRAAELLELRAAVLGQGNLVEYRRWDWHRGAYTDLVSLPADRHWIVEGSGSLTADTAHYASFAVWIDLPEQQRLSRLSARETEGLAWWQQWQQSHEAFAHAQHSVEFADFWVTESES